MELNKNKIDGLKLYTLQSNFSEDVTKNCGLTGGEIDSNFLFLRNNDIYSGEIVGDDLFLYKGGEPHDETTQFIKIPFNTASSINTNKVYTVNSINGDGTTNNPLRISSLYTSSFLAPVKTVIDKTNGEIIPEKYKENAFIITKENKNSLGCLYNFKALTDIKEKLEYEKSTWRVPENSDWYEMLNALEICNSKNHNQEKNGDYGLFAGAYLKIDGDMWDEISPVSYSYGFKASATGIKTPIEENVIGANKITVYWSSTENNINEIWARQLDSLKPTVKIRSVDKNGFYSLRLVNDNIDLKEIKILGETYEVVKMPYVKLNEKNEIIENGYRLWTASNINHELSQNSITLKNNEGYTWFLTKWNGLYWDKRELKENDSFFIEEKNNKLFKFDGTNIVELQKSIVDLDKYYTKEEVNDIVANIDLSDYATKQWVNEQGFLKEHQDISHLAEKSELPTKVSELENDSKFITIEEVPEVTVPTKTSELTNDSGFITINDVPVFEIPDEYVTENELNEVVKQTKEVYVTEFSVNDIIIRLNNRTTNTFITSELLEAVENNKVILIPYYNNSSAYNGVVASAHIVKYSSSIDLYVIFNYKTSLYQFTAHLPNDITSLSLNEINPTLTVVQPELISGKNIKTVNMESIIGEGNLDVNNVYVTEFTLDDLEKGSVLFTNELWDAANRDKIIMVAPRNTRQGGYIANVNTRTLTTDKVEIYFTLLNPDNNTKYYFKSSFIYSEEDVHRADVTKTYLCSKEDYDILLNRVEILEEFIKNVITPDNINKYAVTKINPDEFNNLSIEGTTGEITININNITNDNFNN
jgi:uncharacterized protein (TIGR02145 family)